MKNKSTSFIDFSEIINRIKTIKSLKYDHEVANLIGLNRKAFSARKRSGRIPIDKLKIFCAQESVKYDWLVSESGTTDLPADGEIHGNDLPIDMKQINLWSLRPGFTSGVPPFSSVEGPLLLIKSNIWLKVRGPIKAFTIEGVDSSPHVKNGDIVIVAFGERTVEDQHLYAILTRQYLDIRHCSKKDKLLVVSPRREGESTEIFDLEKSSDPLFGRVIGIIKSPNE